MDKQTNNQKCMHKNEKVDLRILKTQRVIRDAFVALLNEKAFDEIQVQEIIERAMVNRSTFYRYFRGKNDLASKLIKQFLQQYEQRVTEGFQQGNVRLAMQRRFLEIAETHQLVLALWKINTKRHHLYQDMLAILQRAFIQYAQQHIDSARDWSYYGFTFATLALATNRFYFERGEVSPIPAVFDQWQEIVDLIKKA